MTHYLIGPDRLNNLLDEIFYDFFGGSIGKIRKTIINLSTFLFSVGEIVHFLNPTVYIFTIHIFLEYT